MDHDLRCTNYVTRFTLFCVKLAVFIDLCKKYERSVSIRVLKCGAMCS